MPIFLNPIDTNKLLQKLEGKSKSNKINKADNFWFKLVYIIALASIWLPYLVWKIIKPKIKDIVFTGTNRFAVLAVLVPIFYLIQTLLIYIYLGFSISLYFILACISLSFLLKLIPYKS